MEVQLLLFEAGFRGTGQWVGDQETRPTAVGCGHRDLTTHGGRELADDCETQPSPPGSDDGVTLPTEEPGEDLLTLRRRDARALVVDRELGASAVLGDVDADDSACG